MQTEGKMLHRGLSNPLAAVDVVNQLTAVCEKYDAHLSFSNDLEEFYAVRNHVREGNPSPMFDFNVTELEGKSFWIGLRDSDETVIGLQACRLDLVDTSLAEWAIGWMSGLYMKRDQLMVPAQLKPYPESRSYRLRGNIVYHGELWLASPARRQPGLADAFCFMGMVASHLKWQPDAIWALVSNTMATRGMATRFGYLRQERSFLNWKISPEDVPNNEWLLLLEKNDMEHLIEERSKMGPISTEA